MVVFMVAFFAIMWGVVQRFMARGEDLNRSAWEATYSERNLPIPGSGPREGYWGRRLGKATPDSLLGWHDSETHVDGLLDVDGSGYQHYRSREQGGGKFRIAIVGASTAAGAYASSIATTYFNVIGQSLDRSGMPSDIDILAAGAWKSIQEIKALERYLQQNRPDLVIFLNGLNDLTNGATSGHLYGEPFRTPDGVVTDPLYHSHDYEQRVSDYLNNMAVAGEMTSVRGIGMLVVLQPSLNERAKRTAIEERLLAASLAPHASSQALATGYDAIRRVLSDAQQAGNIRFLDCSRIFDRERETTFADLWHFSDAGHRVLGSIMANEIFGIMSKRLQSASIREGGK